MKVINFIYKKCKKEHNKSRQPSKSMSELDP